MDDLRALELRVAQRSKVVASGPTAVPAEDSMASAGIQPRGHGLVGAWIRCKGVPLARCVAFDAVSGVCILEDGKKERTERLHGPGATPFEVLSLPPPFGVEATASCKIGAPRYPTNTLFAGGVITNRRDHPGRRRTRSLLFTYL